MKGITKNLIKIIGLLIGIGIIGLVFLYFVGFSTAHYGTPTVRPESNKN